MNSMVIGPSSWIVNVYQAGYPEIWLVGMLQNSVDSARIQPSTSMFFYPPSTTNGTMAPMKNDDGISGSTMNITPRLR